MFQRLDDRAELAHMDWLQAKIDRRHDPEAALRRLRSAYDINEELGRLEAKSVVGRDIGKILLDTGEVEAARPILERSHDGFERLRKHRKASEVKALLERIP